MVKKYLYTWFWEFAQNAPLILAFTYGFARFTNGDFLSTGWVIFAGVSAGALLIRFTETKIANGQVESWRETAVNFLFFSLAILLFIIYFSRTREILHIDLLTGIAAGILASYLQARAAQKRQDLLHTLSLAAAFAVAVWLIRSIALSQSPILGALTINIPVTTVIVWIEYRSTFSGSIDPAENPPV